MSEPKDLLPPNATPFERAQSKTSARMLETDTDAIRRERDPARCDPQFLPFLAAERSVHHYQGDEGARRAAVASSFDDHLSYGTAAALEGEIEKDTGVPVRIVEFFESDQLEWPDFMVVAEIDPGDPQPDMGPVIVSALRRRNVRDTLAKARIRVRQPPATLFFGAATHVSPHVRVLPVGALPPDPQILVAACSRAMPRVKILPLRTP